MRFFAALASTLFALTTLIDSNWTAIDGWRCIIAGTLGAIAYMLNSILRRWIAQDAAEASSDVTHTIIWHQVQQRLESAGQASDGQPLERHRVA